MKFRIFCISLAICLLSAIPFAAIAEHDANAAEAFVRACYEVPDPAAIPAHVIERNPLTLAAIQGGADAAAIEQAALEDAENMRAFLDARFAQLCVTDIIDDMQRNLILPDYYQAMGAGGFAASVGDVRLDEMVVSPDETATRRLYGYEVDVTVSGAEGTKTQTVLSGRIATDIVDGSEQVVYVNYGGAYFPEYPQ